MDPDPTPFFSDVKGAKKSFHIFAYNLPSGTLSSVLKIDFFLKFCVKILFRMHKFQAARHLYEKREGSGAGSVPDKWIRIREVQKHTAAT